MIDLNLQLEPGERRFYALMGEALEQLGTSAHLVGGFPRDLLLGKTSQDVDLVIEGEALRILPPLRAEWVDYFKGEYPAPTKAIAFKRYGTAKLYFAEPLFRGITQLDFASTRSEIYPTSGKAPQVTFSDLAADLARRDFSINALAIAIAPASFSTLTDQFNGLRDLRSKKIAVLHGGSFQDDPARLIRASRLAARLDFSLEPETLRLFQQAVQQQFLNRLPGARLFDEFRKALVEPDPFRALLALESSGILAQIVPGLPDLQSKAGDSSKLVELDSYLALFAQLLVWGKHELRGEVVSKFSLTELQISELQKIQQQL